MQREPLTDKQQAVLDCCKDHYAREGAFPTMREIQAQMDLSSVNGAWQYVDALRKKGYLEKRAGSYVFTEEHLFLGPDRLGALEALYGDVLSAYREALLDAGYGPETARAEIARWRGYFEVWLQEGPEASPPTGAGDLFGSEV